MRPTSSEPMSFFSRNRDPNHVIQENGLSRLFAIGRKSATKIALVLFVLDFSHMNAFLASRTTLPPQAMLVALRRRLRLALPLCPSRCGPTPGCGGTVDASGDHAPACPRTGLLGRRAKVVERAWVRVPWGRKARSCHNSGSPTRLLPQDRRRLDLVVYGSRGGALCCDATLVSPLNPQPWAVQVDGAALQVAESRRQGRRRGVRMGDDGGAPYQWRCSSRWQALP